MNNTPEQIREALAFISASIPRDEWARVAMAIKSAYPDSTGFELFDTWSQTDPDGYNPTDARDTWKSIQAVGGVGIGTLFHLAKANGHTHTPGKRLDPATVQSLVGERAARELLANQESKQKQQRAASLAAQRWQAASPVNDHPYLATKGVKAFDLKMEGESLLIPLFDAEGAIHTLQVIDAQGEKRFQSDGRIKGCFYPIGRLEGVIIVCEGYATGASIHEATGYAVAVAFNAGNLLSVVQALHQKYPALVLMLAADDDWQRANNPGMTQAMAAARAVGGWLAVPTFSAERPEKATDFNDLHKLAGLGTVKACIDAAQPMAEAPDYAVPQPGERTVNPWPDPVALPDALPAVAPFDAEILPEALRGWVADVAHRMQCPPDFPAVGAMVAISSLIGARAVVAPKARDDWRVVPNLWGLIVGRPGVMKSPALGEVLKHLHRMEATERDQWKVAHDEWARDTKVSELATKDNEKKASKIAATDPAKARALLEPIDIPAEPPARRYVVNDATVEKLGEILEANTWGTLSYRDEIHGLLCSMDRQGQEGARAFYLQAYDGNQGYTVDRIIRGTHYLPRVCLAMLGGIQPGKVQSYVREAVAGGAADDGLLQRFGLAVWPDVSPKFHRVDQWPDTQAKQAAWAVFDRLNQLQSATATDPQEWRFTPEAQSLYWEWVEPFETEIRGEELHPALISHLSKYRKLVPALALIFALVDTPDSGHVIHERELMRALAWADYLRTHAERLYAAAVIPETAGAKQLLDKIKTGKLCDSDGVLLEVFTPRLVAVKHWAGLDSTDGVRKAADLLADYGWLARDLVPSSAAGGRPSDRYLIHPMLLKGGA